MRLAGGTRARARSPGRAAASGREAVRLGALPASRRGRRVAAGFDDDDFAQSRQIARQEARRWPADESRAPSRPGLGACGLDLERRHGGVDTCEGNSQTKVRPMARPRGVRDARPNRNVERRASRSRRPHRRPAPPGVRTSTKRPKRCADVARSARDGAASAAQRAASATRVRIETSSDEPAAHEGHAAARRRPVPPGARTSTKRPKRCADVARSARDGAASAAQRAAEGPPRDRRRRRRLGYPERY